MAGQKAFDLDLPWGQVAEGLFRDILYGVDGAKTEVKRDAIVSESGNLAIELESRGKDSGLITTEANWWVHFLDGPEYTDLQGLPEVAILWSVRRLRSQLEAMQNIGTARIAPGGDDYTSENWLLPLSLALAKRSAFGSPPPIDAEKVERAYKGKEPYWLK